MTIESLPNKELTNHNSNHEARRLFDQYVKTPETAALGPVIEKGISSSEGPFFVLPNKVQYPEVVTSALKKLYEEYNYAFRPLVAANQEWPTDYQYVIRPDDGTPVNLWVQIDMVGLPGDFLRTAPHLGEEMVREILRGRIYEIENSLAMYQLLENLFPNGSNDTFFKQQFRASLDEVRQRYGRKIALLAVTDAKYKAMRESEFGKMDGGSLRDDEVYTLSGFDRFFGPQDFEQYLAENKGECDYLLYARTSDPLDKLIHPKTEVTIPLLEDDYSRQIIKANALTLNVDNPAWPVGDNRRINDTKAWMPSVGMGYPVYSLEDLETDVKSKDERGKDILIHEANPNFTAYLRTQGIETEDYRHAFLRAKPMQHHYGCYGHTRGSLAGKFRRELRKGLRERGPYIIQPEMPVTKMINKTNGMAYTYIDRVFFSTDGQNYRYMGGFRSLMPVDTIEAQRGRNHGSKYTVWAEIS